MKIVQEISLISVGSFEESSDWSIIRAQIREAISLIVHPPGIAGSREQGAGSRGKSAKPSLACSNLTCPNLSDMGYKYNF